jgi:hypothetical protein
MSLRRALTAGLAAMMAALVLAGAAGAKAGGVSITTDRSQVTTGLGDRFSFQTTIANDGSSASGSLIAHLNILSLQDGTYVDPEDWSTDRTVYLGTLPAGGLRTITWNIHAVNTGSLAAYVTVLPQDDVDPPPITGTAVRFEVAERDTLNAGGILPIALGVPAALALLVGAAHLARRRRGLASSPVSNP